MKFNHFFKLLLLVVSQIVFINSAHSSTVCDSSLKNCPAECKPIMTQIYAKMNDKKANDSEKGVKQRYYELLFDEFGLSANPKTTQPPHGSWAGHIKKFNETKGELAILVNQAQSSKQCKSYVTTEMSEWAKKPAPTQPNRKVAADSGYITPDKIARMKKLGKLK